MMESYLSNLMETYNIFMQTQINAIDEDLYPALQIIIKGTLNKEGDREKTFFHENV